MIGILSGCTSTNREYPTTEQITEITTSASIKPPLEITNSNSTKQTTTETSSTLTPTLSFAETTSLKQAEVSIETPDVKNPTSFVVLDDTIYIGEYLDSSIMEPNLEIAKNDNGKYTVQIGIYRLAFFDDGVGELTADGIIFTATDPSGNPISGIITREEQMAIVTFTNSTWEYINNGSVFQYTKSSDIPDIWSDEFSIPSSYIGTWQLDGEKTSQCLEEGWSLQIMFGTGIHNGSSVEISEDGSFSYYIGIGNGGTGQLTAEGDGFSVTITPYESHADVLEVLHLRIENDSDKLYLIMDNYREGNSLYWTKQ